jgi:hypothetical protein
MAFLKRDYNPETSAAILEALGLENLNVSEVTIKFTPLNPPIANVQIQLWDRQAGDVIKILRDKTNPEDLKKESTCQA